MTGAKISEKSNVSPAVGTMMIPVETAVGGAGRLPLSALFVPLGYENGLTAYATGGQTNALALSTSAHFHRISTCATAGDSVKFGAVAAVNDWHYIRNDGAAACQVFGYGTDTINGVATATGVSLDPGHGAFFVCVEANKWTTTGLLGVTAARIAAIITAATGKTTPVDADELALIDSEASNVLKKVTWANVKATLKSYFDSLTTTLTNKRITPRVGTTTSHATPTINTDNVDIFNITAQAEAITSMTSNLSGTPTSEQCLIINITGTASRAITWGSSFESSTVTLPTTTSGTNKLSVAFLYNSATSKFRCVGVA